MHRHDFPAKNVGESICLAPYINITDFKFSGGSSRGHISRDLLTITQYTVEKAIQTSIHTV